MAHILNLSVSAMTSANQLEKGILASWSLGALVLSIVALEGVMSARTVDGMMIAAIGFGLMALATMGATAWIGSGRTGIPNFVVSILIAVALSLRASYRIVDNYSPAAEGVIFGLAFVLLAVAHRGSRRVFWIFSFPIASIAALGLLFAAEYRMSLALVHVRQIGVALFIGWAIAAVIAFLRDARSEAKESSREAQALQLRMTKLTKELRSLGGDMKSILGLVEEPQRTNVRAAGEQVAIGRISAERLAMDSASLTTEESNRAFGSQVSFLSFAEIQEIAKKAVEAAKLSIPEKTRVQLLLAQPSDMKSPIAVRFDGSVQLEKVLVSCLRQGIEALGGADGSVRVSLHAGVSQVTIAIEDNGRGLKQDILNKLGAADVSDRMKLDEVRSAVEACEGRFEYQARLGVGARVTLDLVRVDAFATGRTSLARGENQTQAPNSMHA